MRKFTLDTDENSELLNTNKENETSRVGTILDRKIIYCKGVDDISIFDTPVRYFMRTSLQEHMERGEGT